MSYSTHSLQNVPHTWLVHTQRGREIEREQYANELLEKIDYQKMHQRTWQIIRRPEEIYGR